MNHGNTILILEYAICVLRDWKDALNARTVILAHSAMHLLTIWTVPPINANSVRNLIPTALSVMGRTNVLNAWEIVTT